MDKLLREIEKNGLHIIINEECLLQSLKSYQNWVIRCIKDEEDYDENILKLANKSIANVENEFKKAYSVAALVNQNSDKIIDMIQKTKAGLFNKKAIFWLYRLNVKACIENTFEYFSQEVPAIVLASFNSECWYGSPIDYYSYAYLSKKYGNNFEKSGKFVFLGVAKNGGLKKVREFLFDKNLNIQNMITKDDYLTELKVGHMYKGDNRRNYLCIPWFAEYRLGTGKRNLYRESSWGKVKFQLPDNVNEKNLPEFITTTTYLAQPVLMECTKAVQEELKQFHSVQEITYSIVKGTYSAYILPLPKTKKMLEDLGPYLSSNPKRIVTRDDYDNICIISNTEVWKKELAKVEKSDNFSEWK